MKKIVVAIPHSHSWFWTQTCVASLVRNPPLADGYEVEIVIVDNSPWSPAIRGITDIAWPLLATTKHVEGVYPQEYKSFTAIYNYKSNKFHASALDCVVEKFDFDLLLTMETDVIVCCSDWLQWFVDQLRDTDYAVGHWHHENFVSPCCTLYRGGVLRKMADWCEDKMEYGCLRWGPDFKYVQEISVREPERDYQSWYGEQIDWIAGPFAEKRGFEPGTVCAEKPSGQDKGPGWYEPGQQLHHWATNAGHTYTVCPTMTTFREDHLPLQTLYGASMPDPQRQLEAIELFGNCRAAHMWGGTRALDIIKHDVTCDFVKSMTPYWLAREARYWKHVVPEDVQAQTLDLIRQYGWYYTGQGNTVSGGDERDRRAAEFVCKCYADGGICI